MMNMSKDEMRGSNKAGCIAAVIPSTSDALSDSQPDPAPHCNGEARQVPVSASFLGYFRQALLVSLGGAETDAEQALAILESWRSFPEAWKTNRSLSTRHVRIV